VVTGGAAANPNASLGDRQFRVDSPRQYFWLASIPHLSPCSSCPLPLRPTSSPSALAQPEDFRGWPVDRAGLPAGSRKRKPARAEAQPFRAESSRLYGGTLHMCLGKNLFFDGRKGNPASPATHSLDRFHLGVLMTELSILDLVRVTEETDARGALDNARDLAAHAETWDYRRVWVARATICRASRAPRPQS
jgi:hypothetical protein